MGGRRLPDPLGIFGAPTDLFGKPQEQAPAQIPNATLIDAAAASAVAEPEVRAMPSPNDETVQKAKRRSVASQRRRVGRAATIMTEEGLGG